MEINLTDKELVKLGLIFTFIDKLENLSEKELQDVAVYEMAKTQPMLQKLARHLYLTEKFSTEQMKEITRLLILVWWYYNGWVKGRNKKIDGPLYDEMRKKYEAFQDKMEEKSVADVIEIMKEMHKSHPARLLLGQIQGRIYKEESNSLSTLSKASKADLLSHFRIIMDCFEAIVDRSIGTIGLN